MIENSTTQKKVCHVTSAHPRYDVRIFHKECKSLANNGFDVTLLVNDNLPNETIDKVKIVSTQLKLKNRLERMVKSKKKIQKLMFEINADIYHFHDPELLPEAAWIRKKGKKVIFDFHEDVTELIFFKNWIPKSFRKIISRGYKLYESQKIVKFDALVSVTPKFVKRLSKYNDKTYMVTNFPSLMNTVNKMNYRGEQVNICFAGGISSEWNHGNIIEAIEDIPNLKYILAGRGPQKYFEGLKTLCGWEKVHYLGVIPHEEVLEVYNQSVVGMTLLDYNTQVGKEGTLGNTKIFEFMQAGLPVICSKNRIWEEIINKYECGIAVNPDNILEIREAIKKLILNPDYARELGKNGQEAVKVEYNWKTQEKVLLEMYQELFDETGE